MTLLDRVRRPWVQLSSDQEPDQGFHVQPRAGVDQTSAGVIACCHPWRRIAVTLSVL